MKDTTKLDEKYAVIDKAVVEAINALRMEHVGRAYDILTAACEAVALAHEPAAEWRVPTGWKLVPVEPTLYMLRRADGLTDLVGPYLGANTVEERRNEFACAWKAMLDAAPPPPEVQP